MSRAALLVGVALVATFASQSHAQSSAGGGVRLPPFEQHTLANGVVLVLMEKHDTPLVSMRALLRGGSLGDPAGKEGSAALLAELLQKGAGKRDAVTFADAIESAGGELAASAETESLAVGASFLARDVDLMVELVADALLRPRLDAQEFAKARDARDPVDRRGERRRSARAHRHLRRRVALSRTPIRPPHRGQREVARVHLARRSEELLRRAGAGATASSSPWSGTSERRT